MLLSIRLFDDETEDGGMLMACQHHAIITSITIIILFLDFLLYYPSMLLPIYLFDDETEDGGRLMACHHHAIITSITIIISSCILTKDTGLKVNCGDGQVANSAGVDYTGSWSHKPARSGPRCDSVALCMDLKWVAGFGSCRGNQAEQDPNCLPP